ncbi:bacteriophage protein [Escherichia coli]|nr:bacteriophage protein [Escherichia coli]
MVAYTNDKKYVRYRWFRFRSVPVQYRGLYQIVTYYGQAGVQSSQCIKKLCPMWTVSDNQNGPERGLKETEMAKEKLVTIHVHTPFYADARRSVKTGVWPGTA